MLSKRSSRPPWPGIVAAMSLMPRSRLIDESVRSPNWPAILTKSPRPTNRARSSSGVPANTSLPSSTVSSVVRTALPASRQPSCGACIRTEFPTAERLAAAIAEHIVKFDREKQHQHQGTVAGVIGQVSYMAEADANSKKPNTAKAVRRMYPAGDLATRRRRQSPPCRATPRP